MTATKKTVRTRVTAGISISCLLVVSGCVRKPSVSPAKTGSKAVKVPSRLGVEFGVESEQAIGKDIKSGMAYKPATFLFGHSSENNQEHEEYEDIPLPIGVADVRYELGSENSAGVTQGGQANQKSNSGDGAHADWCATNWCAQGQCAGDSALYYTVDQSVEQLINFYVCNMERLGWQLTADFYSRQVVLFFDRYGKRCAIFLSPDISKSGILKSGWLDKWGDRRKQTTHVTIFVSLRTVLL